MSTQVAGVLRDPFERPLANTDIDIRAITNTFAILPGNTIKVTTNAQGEYNFILEPANYAVSVILDGRSVYQGAISVTSTTAPGTLPELLKQAEMESELPLNYAEYFHQVQETVKDDADRAQAAADSIGDELALAQQAAQDAQQSSASAAQSEANADDAYQKTKVISDKYQDIDNAVTETQQNAAQTSSDAQNTAADRQASESAAQRAEDAANSAETVNERNIRVPQGETINALPAATSRANSVAAFDSSGQSVAKKLTDFALLDASNKIPLANIPAAAITEVFPVSSQAQMLSLTADPGDVAKRTDLGASFILMSAPASTLENWVRITEDVLIQLASASGGGLVGYKSSAVGSMLRTVASKFEERKSIKDFGAVGDGTTDDSAAFNAAISAAKGNFTLLFPAGKYLVNNPQTLSGRLFLEGYGDATLIGAFNYSDTFPASADNPSGVTNATPFFSANGLIFRNDSKTTYGLTVSAQAGSSFLDCMEMSLCKFFGYYGWIAKNLISVNVTNCWFYNLYKGMELQGCANINVIGCWFRNSRKIGASVTYNPDDNRRKGGENIRFTNCEFAVCSKGIYAFRHVWLNISNCLFDYNILPVELHGSYYAKISNSYLGASYQGSLTGGEGFENPATKGCALYGHAADADAMGSASYCGVTVENCELVNYLSGTNIPIAYMEGSLASSPGSKLVERASFIGNKFLATQSHSATSLLAISSASESFVSGNNFISPDLSTTLTQPYVINSTDMHNGIGNMNVKCTQSGVRVPMTYDNQLSAGIRAIPTIGAWIQNSSGNNVIGVNSSNQLALANVTESTTAVAGGAATPSGYAGYVTVIINGNARKIGFYAQ